MAGARHDPTQRLPLQMLTADYLTTVLKSNALEHAANGELAVLVVDTFTLRVLTSCLTMDDILAAGYAAVDKFESKSKLAQGVGRAAYFPLHVVYYCRPSPANLHRILMDYSAPVEDAPDCFERYFPCIFGDITLTVPPPMYNRASLVITAARAGAGQDNAALAAAELLRQSRASAEFQRFGEYFNPHTVVPECLVEFFPLDTNLFSLEMPDAVKTLYSAAAVAATPAAIRGIRDHLDLIAFRLSTVCAALNEHPYIRYRQRRTEDGSQAGRSYPATLATFLEAHLAAYRQAHPEWAPVGHGKGGSAAKGPAGNQPTEPATVLILDRVDDLAAVMMHDLGYQSLLGDLIHWIPGEPKAVPDPDTDGRTAVELQFDDRSDPIFRETRYTRWQDLQDAQDGIFRAVQEQTRAVSQLGAAATSKDYRKLTTFIAKGGESVLQFRSLVHAQVTREIARLIGAHAFPAVVDLEQNMLTEVDDAGGRVRQREANEELERLLASRDVLPLVKARLLMLWLLTAESCDLRVWNRLCQVAALPEHLSAALLHAQYVGLPTSRGDRRPVDGLCPDFDRKRESARAKAMLDSTEKVRAVPKVRAMAEAHLGGTLDEVEWPYVRLPPAEHSADAAVRAAAAGEAAAAGAAAGGHSDRTASTEARDVIGRYKHAGSRRDRTKRKFRDREAAGAAADVSTAGTDGVIEKLTSDVPEQRQGARTIVFFLGGITPAEAGSLEALAAASGREIVYGGTAVTNAAHFLDQLVLIGEEGVGGEDDDL